MRKTKSFKRSLREVSDRLYFKRPVRLVSSASVSPHKPPQNGRGRLETERLSRRSSSFLAGLEEKSDDISEASFSSCPTIALSSSVKSRLRAGEQAQEGKQKMHFYHRMLGKR